ncbi:MAG: site-specific DNA-methyltransferase [Bacteroidaceae bacterium]|nr:site-specific DNA-methyltransferase [Bacteroidaceae bacterium]
MDKSALVDKIKLLEGLTNDEKANLIGLLRSHKKYGLVWEEKAEDVEERLREQLPVLTEVKERAIVSDDADAPNHILIEGDNLEALTALSYSHEGKIDVIYIDPPYNTGNKDFVYNDSFVDKEDGYRHSKWLSFMNRRLNIAKRLLINGGIIFISIDDNEEFNLKPLCDQIFGEKNCIGILPTIMNLKGNQDEFGFAGTHEYSLVYSNNKNNCVLGSLNVSEEELEEWLEDEIGFYKKGATLKRTGTDAPRVKRPYGYFPILVNTTTKEVSCITLDEYKNIYNPTTKSFDDNYVNDLMQKYHKLGYEVLLPIVNKEKASWRWGFTTVKNNKKEVIVIGENNSYSLYKKQRPEIGNLPTKKPKSVLYKAQYSSGNGTSQLKELGLERTFNNPKPLELICDFLRIGSTISNSTILDFFAGSGTTLHATMQLNAEDGGNRQCILVTNNENKICEEVTYERNKRVINGYTTPKGEHIEGLKRNTLRYYQTELLPREHSPRNMRELMSKATDLLCIKEDLYTEQPMFGRYKTYPKALRYFADAQKQMLILYQEEFIPEIVEEIKGMDFGGKKLKVYLYSPGHYAFEDDFFEVQDKVELIALPSSIYKAYKEVLPKAKDKLIELANEETTEGGAL